MGSTGSRSADRADDRAGRCRLPGKDRERKRETRRECRDDCRSASLFQRNRMGTGAIRTSPGSAAPTAAHRPERGHSLDIRSAKVWDMGHERRRRLRGRSAYRRAFWQAEALVTTAHRASINPAQTQIWRQPACFRKLGPQHIDGSSRFNNAAGTGVTVLRGVPAGAGRVRASEAGVEPWLRSGEYVRA